MKSRTLLFIEMRQYMLRYASPQLFADDTHEEKTQLQKFWEFLKVHVRAKHVVAGASFILAFVLASQTEISLPHIISMEENASDWENEEQILESEDDDETLDTQDEALQEDASNDRAINPSKSDEKDTPPSKSSQEQVRRAPLANAAPASPPAHGETRQDTLQGTYPSKTVTLVIGKGDTLGKMLQKVGVAATEAHKAVMTLSKQCNLRKLQIGQSIDVCISRSNASEPCTLEKVSLQTSPINTLHLTCTGGNCVLTKDTIKLVRRIKIIRGVTKGTLHQSIIQKGVPMSISHKVVQGLSHKVNFKRDNKSGTPFEIAYEVFTSASGDILRNGNVLYASFAPQGSRKACKIYYFDGPQGQHFYDDKGTCLVQRSGMMGSPLPIRLKINSPYGYRTHPVFRVRKFHNGVDYKAPRGTRVLAAGDGVVTKARYFGGYGLYVCVKHGKYETEYAHLSTIKVRAGQRVKRGQLLGQVGATGTATAPHLHFGVKCHGKFVNPRSVKMIASNTMSKKDHARFTAFKNNLDKKIKTTADSV